MKFEFHKVCKECTADFYCKAISEDQFCDLRDSKLPEIYEGNVGKIILHTVCPECSDRISDLMGL